VTLQWLRSSMVRSACTSAQYAATPATTVATCPARFHPDEYLSQILGFNEHNRHTSHF
jgi:hypothetical protein